MEGATGGGGRGGQLLWLIWGGIMGMGEPESAEKDAGGCSLKGGKRSKGLEKKRPAFINQNSALGEALSKRRGELGGRS